MIMVKKTVENRTFKPKVSNSRYSFNFFIPIKSIGRTDVNNSFLLNFFNNTDKILSYLLLFEVFKDEQYGGGIE